uniref:N-methyltransferase n=1 Tax=Plectus sambesii TaxID=2011161 RepID=A0A914XET0_9BILA
MEELEQRLAITEEKKQELFRNNLGLVLDRDFFHVAFNTDAYLHDFYTQLEEPAMRMVHTYMPTIVAKLPKGGRMCDFGAGPTIHLGVCFRHSVDEIFFADYLPQNRNELVRWINKESNFDWSTVLRTIACHEGAMNSWLTMEEETRSKVRGVLHCDCLKDSSIEYPTDVAEGFDVRFILNTSKS